MRPLTVSTKCFAFLFLSLNAFIAVFILRALEKECVSNDQSITKTWDKRRTSFESFLSVVIFEFEEFENKLSETIDSVCERLPKAIIYVISDNLIYPGVKLSNKVQSSSCKVYFLTTSVNPVKSFRETRPEYWLKTEYVLILSDCTLLPEEHPLSSLKYSDVPDNSIIAIPIVSGDGNDDFFSCFKLTIDLKQWTLDYTESNHQSECNALSGSFAFFTKTSTFLQLNSPFERPLQDSLFIQSKFRNLTVKVDDDTRFLKMNCAPVDEHMKWKMNTMHRRRLTDLYAKFGIKKLVKANGETEWFGCNKNSARCFPTVHNDMPNYLFEGKWTPPCCLQHLRTTARHVFEVLESKQIRYWLEGGSLLGAARNGDIIPWDYDVDIGIYEEDIDKCFYLKQSKHGPVKDPQGFVWEQAIEGDFFRVQFSASNRLHVDIFPFYSRNGTMTKNTWFENHRQDMEFPEHYLKPLKKLNFVGWKANIPNNHIQFLELKFGVGVVDNPQYPVPSMLQFTKI